MMRKMAVLAALMATAGVVQAEDKPRIAPTPAWVKRIDVPPVAGKADEAPIRILASDQQMRVDGDGQTLYTDVWLAMQTAQGLGAGNLSLPWRPETDVLTVHALEIHRGGKVVDVLGAGGQSFTVVRREPNLEAAMLDGVLTANIQPEGLQVGDTLRLAMSVTTKDPVMRGHAEGVVGAWNGIPVGRAHLSIVWPTTVPVKTRTDGGLVLPKPVANDGMSTIDLALTDLQPVFGPKGAPLRYQMGRMVEVSDFAGWAEVGSLLAPLYTKAAAMAPQGALAAEVAKIRAASSDPKVRTAAALALAQDRIRYVALAMGAGGLVPTDADTTWSRRYGDCKAKTALLLAILSALDIWAEPVAVSTGLGDGMNERLPRVGGFDHVLVRATVGDRTYWLDGTRKGDTDIDRLRTPGFGWGLPLVAKGAALVRMAPATLTVPDSSTAIRIDASAGLTLPAPITVETILRGDDAVGTNAQISALTGEARDRALREYWKGRYDFVEVTGVRTKHDAKTGELRLSMTGKAKMDWSTGWYETDGSGLAYRADFTRDPGPNRDAPYAVNHPFYTTSVETIVLPPGFPDLTAPERKDVDRTVAGVEYRRKVSLTGGTFRVESSERSIASEFSAKDAPAAQAALREMAGQAVYIRRPDSYVNTSAEQALLLESKPTTVSERLARGSAFLDAGLYDDALADFEAALTLEPKNSYALADRGIAKAWKNDAAGAQADFAAALAIEPRNAAALRGRGLAAEHENRPEAAVADFTRALEIDPRDTFSLYHRASNNAALKRYDAALADATAAIAIRPAMTDMYQLRASVYLSTDRKALAAKEAAAVVAANPGMAEAHISAGRILNQVGQRAEAVAAFDKALAIKPAPYTYLGRSMVRGASDYPGQLADIDAALKLDATFEPALARRASVLRSMGQFRQSAAAYTALLAKNPTEVNWLTSRAVALAKAGDTVASNRDLVLAGAQIKDSAEFLNNFCWALATHDVGLQTALSSCEAALVKQPDYAGYLDSKGLVLLRLGRLDDAIATYDRALAKDATMAGSLYGRSIAWKRKGDATKAATDLAAARKARANVEEEFAGYGVVP